jgi:peptidoglycan/xylan/chitin deacetylase (PgdA/CDA1 family)
MRHRAALTTSSRPGAPTAPVAPVDPGDPGRFRLRSPARGLVKAVLVHAQAVIWRVRGSHADAGLRILTYHRVGPGRDQLNVPPSRFLRQMEIIERSGLPVVDLSEAIEAADGLDTNAIALTFDDGYGDQLRHALPALEARGWPATVFVCPGAVEGRIRFPWYSGEPDVISWEEMRAVEARSRIRFEPHTLTHPDLPSLDAASAEREIRGSKDAVEAALGRASRTFAYPGGFFGRREADLAAEAGYGSAVGTEYGVNRRPWDRYALRRVPVDPYDTHALFAARIRGATDEPPLGRRQRQAPVQPAS